MLGVQGSETREDADIYILCTPANMTLACLLLMQHCSMHMVPGGAGHVWFIRCVPTHRPRAFILAISIPEWRSLQTLTSSLADSGGDRQTPRYRSVSVDGRCGDLTQSEPRTHTHWMEAHFFPLRRRRVCAALYLMQRQIHAEILVFFCSRHPYTWVTCGIWFIVSFYCSGICSQFAILGLKTTVRKRKKKQN